VKKTRRQQGRYPNTSLIHNAALEPSLRTHLFQSWERNRRLFVLLWKTRGGLWKQQKLNSLLATTTLNNSVMHKSLNR